MKTSFTFFLLIFWMQTTLHAQSNDSLSYELFVLHDSLAVEVLGAPEGIRLHQFGEWKYKSGDNLSWATPDYDDSDWKSYTSPSEIPDSVFTGIAWLRFHFFVDSSFADKENYIWHESRGASDVYVNGKKISAYGTPSADPTKEQYITGKLPSESAVPVQFNVGSRNVLAIRYSHHDHLTWKKWAWDYTFLPIQVSVSVFDREQVFARYIYKDNENRVIEFSCLILLYVFLLHVFMRVRFKDEKGNSWIALLSFLLFFFPFFHRLLQRDTFSEEVHLFLRTIEPFLLVLPVALIPIALGRILHFKVEKIWYYLPWSTPVILPLIYSTVDSDFKLALTLGLYFLCVSVGVVHFLRQAYRNNLRYTWLITIALVSYPLLYIAGILVFTVFQTGTEFLYLASLFLLFTTLPGGFSIYQTTRFFNAHGNLQEEVALQTSELQSANHRLEKSMKELRATQDQLVQQEKLASLGQLTAGIAHEIKNPLNFVNNFSEVSLEMIEELREEVAEVKTQCIASQPSDIKSIQAISEILDDIEANLKKIHEHGSRADSIVKSMLEHSRGGSGKMEPTNLNALVKEFVNLSFHGMRAGKNPINADIQFELDDSIAKVPLVAEDFSRVIINLSNNAFDAMREKLNSEEFKPRITIRTKQTDQGISLEIEDNGPGIPEEIKDKILQPFFTTKKGTEGTGLGLSITHDIVKAHGGRLAIESNERRGTVCTIYLTKEI